MSKSRELLDFARKLLTEATSDIELATAVNRAYYAAYGAAKDFHDAQPHKGRCLSDKVGVHERLIQQLEFPSPQLDPELQRVGKYIAAQMRMLKPLREIADYENNQTSTAHDAESAIRMAEDILDESSRGMKRINVLRAAPSA